MNDLRMTGTYLITLAKEDQRRQNAPVDWTKLDKTQKGDAIRPLIEIRLMSYTEIAAIFGVTRTAIAGAAARNGIIAPVRRSEPTGAKGAHTMHDRRPKKRPVRHSLVAPLLISLDNPPDFSAHPPRADAWNALPGTDPRPVHDHREHECRWPVGDHPARFCCAPTAPESVYCAAHRAMAYKPRETKEKEQDQ